MASKSRTKGNPKRTRSVLNHAQNQPFPSPQAGYEKIPVGIVPQPQQQLIPHTGQQSSQEQSIAQEQSQIFRTSYLDPSVSYGGVRPFVSTAESMSMPQYKLRPRYTAPMLHDTSSLGFAPLPQEALWPEYAPLAQEAPWPVYTPIQLETPAESPLPPRPHWNEPETSPSKRKLRPRLAVTNAFIEPPDYYAIAQTPRSLSQNSRVANPRPSPTTTILPSSEYHSLSSPPRSSSNNAIIAPRSPSSSISVTPIGPLIPQRESLRSNPVDLPSTTHEVEHEDEVDSELSPTPNANQRIQPPSQSSQHGTASWVLPLRKFHAVKRSMDEQFISHMANLRRQTDGASSTSSTSEETQMRLLGSPVSIGSSAFSQSFSVASPPPVVEFPPTPIFTDDIPKGLTRIPELSSAQTPKIFAPRNPHRLQNLHPVAATRSLDTIHEVAGGSSTALDSKSESTPRKHAIKLPTPTRSVRRGYWNRRGDHLTPEGYLVFPPLNLQYPDDLRTYPFEKEGYQDHSGLFTAYIRRPQLPQSLSRHGKPPQRPYESFVVYV